MKFEWDPKKAVENLKKHDVSFEVARLAFDDPFQKTVVDPMSDTEERLNTTGVVLGRLTLFVVHTYRQDEEGEEVTRIISARKASPTERKAYEQAN